MDKCCVCNKIGGNEFEGRIPGTVICISCMFDSCFGTSKVCPECNQMQDDVVTRQVFNNTAMCGVCCASYRGKLA